MADGAGDPADTTNPAPDNGNNVPEESLTPPHTDSVVRPVHPITGDTLSVEREAALKEWALRKGYTMGQFDSDELGDVTEYVFAGALTFADTIQMKSLIKMDRKRPLRLRRAINVNRQQNAQACMAYLCGTVKAKPCGPCSRGSGPFTECVTVDGGLLGACASCHYGGEGNRCTFHVSSKSFNVFRFTLVTINIRVLTSVKKFRGRGGQSR
jgi:hypothetical protein